jgi:hypothetical protein
MMSFASSYDCFPPPYVTTMCVVCTHTATVYCGDCHDSFCMECLGVSHAASPLHSFASISPAGELGATTASNLGLDLNLGHLGELCPDAPIDAPILVAITQSWLLSQSIYVNYCHCPGAPTHEDQLISAGLFPDAAREPVHCFTLECAIMLEESIEFPLETGEKCVTSSQRIFCFSFAQRFNPGDLMER